MKGSAFITSSDHWTGVDVIVAFGNICHVDLLHVLVFIYIAFNRNKLGGRRARRCRLGYVTWCSVVVRRRIPVRLRNGRRGDGRFLRRGVLGSHGHPPLKDRLGVGGLGDVRTCVDIPDGHRFALGLTRRSCAVARGLCYSSGGGRGIVVAGWGGRLTRMCRGHGPPLGHAGPRCVRCGW